MNKKYLAVIVPLILLFTFVAEADVPPPNGYVRTKIDLVTETADDLSDYRFFLDFYGDLREVEIKSEERTTIPPMGGGARYGSGTFLAVPKKSLSDFEGKLSNEQLEKLSESIRDKRIAGVAELAKHRFSADIPKSGKPAEVYYVIKRVENTLKAERVGDDAPKSTSSSPRAISNDSQTGLIIGGIFITLAVFVIGVFAFRKVSKKV